MEGRSARSCGIRDRPRRMIVPDTNAVSEAMKTTAAPEMIDWLNEHETPHPFSTAVTIKEDEAASDPS